MRNVFIVDRHFLNNHLNADTYSRISPSPRSYFVITIFFLRLLVYLRVFFNSIFFQHRSDFIIQTKKISDDGRLKLSSLSSNRIVVQQVGSEKIEVTATFLYTLTSPMLRPCDRCYGIQKSKNIMNPVVVRTPFTVNEASTVMDEPSKNYKHSPLHTTGHVHPHKDD